MQITPETLVSVIVGTDQYMAVILQISPNQKTIQVGWNKGKTKFTLRKDGTYREANCKVARLSFGKSETKFDLHF